MSNIENNIKDIVNSYKNINMQKYKAKENIICKCPLCNNNIIEKQKLYKCDNCNFILWKQIAKKNLTINQVKMLIEKGKTNTIKGFTSSKGKKFSAKLILDNGKVKFDFK